MSSYGNILLNAREPRPVVRELQRCQRTRAWVTPPLEGWITIYDPDVDRGRDQVIVPLLEELTGSLRSVAWAVTCIDDDVLLYWLADRGRVVDRYESWPAYFDERAGDRPWGGDPSLLRTVLNGKGLSGMGSTRALTSALQAGNGDDGPFPFAVERHEAVVDALGLPSRYAYVGWRDVTAADAETEVPDRLRFLPVGQP